MTKEVLEFAKSRGIGEGYSYLIDKSNPQSMGFAMDAALVGNANAGIPVEYTAFLDPAVIKILTAPRRARMIGKEVKIGDWTTPYAKFKTVEETGNVQAYDDYADNGTSDVNLNFPVRDNFVFETVIRYGDREVDTAGMARINLAAEKQRSAANTLDIAMNRADFFGVDGLRIYGLTNDPNLPSAVTLASGAAGSVLWSKKTTNEIFNDIVLLVGDVSKRSKGLVDSSSKMKLIVSPENGISLEQSTQYNKSVKEMMKGAFPNMEIVVAEEMNSSSGNMVQVWAEADDEIATVVLGYSEKLRAGRTIAEMSHFKQKFVAGTYGAVIQRPFLMAHSLGS